MKDSTVYEFKGATIEEATANGLAELGLDREQADIEVINKGGIFSRAKVRITPIDRADSAEESETNEVADAEDVASEEQVADSKVIETDEAVLSEAADKAYEFVKGLVANMDIACDVACKRDGGEISIAINGENASNLIGYRGETLDAIQYYTLLVCNKAENPFIRVQVDAENYRTKRKEVLSALAFRLAKKAAKTGRSVSLEPMNPFERRVIHTALAEDKFVTTKSEGEGRFRHVIITPNERPERPHRERKDGRREGKPKRERRDEQEQAPRTASTYEEKPIEMSYGTGSDFRKKGPTKMRSFGGKAKRF